MSNIINAMDLLSTKEVGCWVVLVDTALQQSVEVGDSASGLWIWNNKTGGFKVCFSKLLCVLWKKTYDRFFGRTAPFHQFCS